TVTTARARIPSASASATRAFSVQAAVRRPTHGAGTRRRSMKAASLASVSSRRRLFGTCRFTTARAEVRPPPTTADERTASGSAVTTTASRSTVTSMPSIIAPRRLGSVPRLQPGQHVDAEAAEAENLHVSLVGGIVEPHREVESGKGAVFSRDVVSAAEVDAMVARVSDWHSGERCRIGRLIELARYHVCLHEQAERAERIPGEAEIVVVVGHPTQLPLGDEVLGVHVRVVGGEEKRF